MSKRTIDEVDEVDEDDRDMVRVDLTHYYDVKTWDRLCGVNETFLRKGFDQTYYHLGPTDPETEPLLPALIELNKRGIYTKDGQPGVYVEDDIRQRAYIDFAVENHEIAKRMLAFLETKPFIYFIYEVFGNRKKIVTNIPKEYTRIALTDAFDEDAKLWMTYTSSRVKWQAHLELSDLKNVDKLLKKAGFFFVCHIEFGVHESLEDMLLEFDINNEKKEK